MEAPKRWWVLGGGGWKGGVLFSSFILSFFSLPLHPHFYFCQFRNEGKPSTGRRGKCLGVGDVRQPGQLPSPHRLPQGLDESSLSSWGGRREEAWPPREEGLEPCGAGGQRLGCPSPTWGRVPAAPREPGAGRGPRAREAPKGGPTPSVGRREPRPSP